MLPQKILVIDSDKDASLITSRRLKKIFDNCEIVTAASPLELNHIISNFSLIITEIRFPDYDAFEFIARIKNHYPEIKIVVTTASYAREVERKAKEMGVDYFLPKPFSLEELKNSLAELKIINLN
ncbi:MAG: response regulator [Candidatus Kerfeldbacteria bacterium]|nr:response regulator [Candidatus Kerfeldbacteria bacterium]